MFPHSWILSTPSHLGPTLSAEAHNKAGQVAWNWRCMAGDCQPVLRGLSQATLLGNVSMCVSLVCTCVQMCVPQFLPKAGEPSTGKLRPPRASALGSQHCHPHFTHSFAHPDTCTYLQPAWMFSHGLNSCYPSLQGVQVHAHEASSHSQTSTPWLNS